MVRLNRSPRDRTLQLLRLDHLSCVPESQSVPKGPYIATENHKATRREKSVSIGPKGTVHCNRLFCDCDDHLTRKALPINCLQTILLASSKFDKPISPPSHSLAVFVIRRFRPPGLGLGRHLPLRTTCKSIKPTGPIQAPAVDVIKLFDCQ